MIPLINTIGKIITSIYNTLDVQLFPDFPVTYIQMIMISFVIVFILRFVFGGFKELNGVENMISSSSYTRMPNFIRKQKLNNDYKNKLVKIANDRNEDVDVRDWAEVELHKMGRNVNGKRYY